MHVPVNLGVSEVFSSAFWLVLVRSPFSALSQVNKGEWEAYQKEQKKWDRFYHSKHRLTSFATTPVRGAAAASRSCFL